MEFGLLLAAASSLGAAWLMLRFTGGREMFDAILTATVVGLFAGRLAAMVLAGTNPVTHPVDLLIVRGGVDTIAASAAAVAFLGWAVRRDLWRSLDSVAPAAVAALAVWHGGCLSGGTCLGTPSSLPWAWAASAGGVTRHPTELYAALGLAAAAVVVLLLRDRLRQGTSAALALGSVSAIRLVTEPLRVTIDGGPWWWYAAGAVVGGGLFAWRTTVGSSPRPLG